MTTVHFKANVLLKNIIGKDLINDDNIAVLELVKNSYDAGAQKVRVYFRDIFNNSENGQHNLFSDERTISSFTN